MNDYLTKPTSRRELKRIAAEIREALEEKDPYSFDSVQALERLPNLFRGRMDVDVQIVDDADIDDDIPCYSELSSDGKSYCIYIKNKVYEGANRGIGGYRAHICHEICHLFLYIHGYLPEQEIPAGKQPVSLCRSGEWQAKALSGYVMVPPDTCKAFAASAIQDICEVSEEMAETMYRVYHPDAHSEAKKK